MTLTDILLSFLPVVLLVVLPLAVNIRFAAVATFVVTSVLYFLWLAPLPSYLATLVASLVATINILMIVFGAVFLFEVMNASGYINDISQSIKEIHPSREVRFFIIAISLSGFFEGVAGFGTPGAIVPLLLISMGFQPLLSVAAVLLFDGLFAAFGAVGTPLLAGLKLPLGLTDVATTQTGIYAAWLLAAAGFPVGWLVMRMYEKQENPISSKGLLLALLAAAFIPFIAFAYLLPEFSTILASVTLLVLSVVYFTKGKNKIDLKAWLPYLALVVLLLLPKLIPALNRLLDVEIGWQQIFSSPVSAALKPLKSPLIPFVLVALLFAHSKKHYLPSFVSSGKKVVSVALLLFPIIAVAQLMLHSGGTKPSMISVIAAAFSETGSAYVLLAPFIGVTGAFITGSTTLSNIVFGASQQQTAQLLGLDTALILGLQLAGASIGNAVCLFNIIAACSVANIREPNKVLVKNLAPSILAALILGAVGYLIVLVWV